MKAMNSDPDKRYPTADAMLEDLEKFRKDPAVDMDYIRKELASVQPDNEPTMSIPTAQVATAVKKRAEQLRRMSRRRTSAPGTKNPSPSWRASSRRHWCWCSCCLS